MNTDDCRIIPKADLEARLARGEEDLKKWVEVSADEARVLKRTPKSRRGRTLLRLRGHLPPER